MILDGKELSEIVLEKSKALGSLFEKKYSKKPCLAVILVGNNPASLTYVASKKKTCERIGFDHKDITLPESVELEEVLSVIDTLNKDDSVDGILVQLPLPKHIDKNKVINSILPEKDVDGFLPSSIGSVLLNQKSFLPCTPNGIVHILDYYGITTEGKDICIVGRSSIVGKPLAAILMSDARNATVTVCHTKTVNLKEKTLRADILVCAAGSPGLITDDMVKTGAIVIDAGITRVPDSTKKSGYRLAGDVDFDSVSEKASAITPVPGGVGPMTIAMLMENTLIAACRRRKAEVEDL